MAEFPVCKIKAGAEIKTPNVLNKQRLDEFVYISIPPFIAQSCVLYDVCEVCPSFVKVEDYAEFMTTEGKYPWIRVKSSRLNQSIGLHVYGLEYVDPSSNATMSLYFAYILQDNDPDKPYIYMNREVED